MFNIFSIEKTNEFKQEIYYKLLLKRKYLLPTTLLRYQASYVNMELDKYIELLKNYSGIYNDYNFHVHWTDREKLEELIDYLNSILTINKLVY